MYYEIAYYAAAIGSLMYVAFAGLIRVAEPEPPPALLRLTPAWAFWLAGATTLVAWRWPAILANTQLNPDESMFLALAHVAAARHVPWLDFDATTSGPFDVWPLTALNVFGLAFSYSTARMLAGVLVLVATFALYRSTSTLFDEASARLSALCAIVFFATSSNLPNFVQYASEIMPVCLASLLGLSIVKLYNARYGGSLLYPCTAGILAGMIPLAKLQVTPIDAALIAVAITAIVAAPSSWRKKAVNLASFVACLTAASAAVLFPVALSGAWNDFLISYIRAPLWWISQGGPNVNKGVVDVVTYVPFFFLTVFSTGLAAVMLILTLRRRSSVHIADTVRALSPFGATVLALLAGVYAVTRAGETIDHHLLLLVIPLCALVGFSFAVMAATSRNVGPGRFAATVLVAALTISSVAAAVKLGNHFVTSHLNPRLRYPVGFTEIRTPAEIALVNAIPENSSLTVWGWAPEAYVISDSIMGTRDAITQFQMWPGPYERYYLRRYLLDLQENQPGYFLDAVRDRGYRGWSLTGSENRLENFEPLARYVSSHYDLIDRANGLKLYRAKRHPSAR